MDITITMDKAEAMVIAHALNLSFHEANNRLNSKEPLGDMERKALEYQRDKAKETNFKYFDQYF